MAAKFIFVELFVPEHKFCDTSTLREGLETYYTSVKNVVSQAVDTATTVFLEKKDTTTKSEFHKVSKDGRIGYWMRIEGFCDLEIAEKDKGCFVQVMLSSLDILFVNIHMYHIGAAQTKVMQ